MNGRSHLISGGLAALLLASLSLPGVALASDVVLPPLIPKGSGTSSRDIANLTSLMSSELDFMPDVDRVIELDKAPGTLNASCLNQASCLAKIGRDAGGDKLLTGTLQMADSGVTFDLVWFDVKASRVIRRQSFQVPNRPEAIADAMDDVVRELITGKAPKAEEDTGGGLSLLDLDDDDDDFAFDDADFEIARREEEQRKREAQERARREAEEARLREAEEASRREAEERARREAEERARREAEEKARRQAAEDARRREAEERARREAEEARRREEARKPAVVASTDDDDDDFDPNAISFGSAPIVMTEDDDDDLPPVSDSGPRRGSTYFTDDEPSSRPSRIVDLDDDEPIARPSRDKSPKSQKSKSAGSSRSGSSGFDGEPSAVQIKLRGGYSPYYRLGFITYGGEVSVRAGDSGVHVIGGISGWSVQREIPPRFQEPGMPTTAWNTIFPLHVGAIYKLDLMEGQLRPYGGVDLIGAQYYVPEDGSGGKISFGARARGGVDYMLANNFGLTADIAIGFWSGSDWEIIERDVKNAGLLPQISGGFVLAF